MMAHSHSPEHEVAILRAASEQSSGSTLAELAEQLVECEDCISYLFRTIDDVSSLHVAARSRAATTKPSELHCIERLDALLDDVMVLLAHRADGEPEPEGQKASEKAEASGRRSVPVGKG